MYLRINATDARARSRASVNAKQTSEKLRMESLRVLRAYQEGKKQLDLDSVMEGIQDLSAMEHGCFEMRTMCRSSEYRSQSSAEAAALGKAEHLAACLRDMDYGVEVTSLRACHPDPDNHCYVGQVDVSISWKEAL